MLAGSEQRGRRQPEHGLPYRHPDRNCTVRLDGEDMVTRGVVQDGFGRALA